MVDAALWRGRRVLLTGHTGFKGGWLSLWLQSLGARVTGLALEPPSSPSLFERADVAQGMTSVIGDIRDRTLVERVVKDCAPEVVLHLAAQPLVRRSYEDPIETYATNVMGTAHVLEAVRRTGGVRAVVVVSSDKCYENREWLWGYRESEALGGYDPYSNSKACTELVASAFRQSFFPPARFAEHGVALGSGRAGNVIGGGDWAADRLVPDLVRAFVRGEPVRIRNPHAIRPWQHVLESVSGYIALAEKLLVDGAAFAEPFNFGPYETDTLPVRDIVETMVRLWGDGASWVLDGDQHPHEASLLRLDSTKARVRLGWRPRLDVRSALEWTVRWYKAAAGGEPMREITLDQIAAYSSKEPAQ